MYIYLIKISADFPKHSCAFECLGAYHVSKIIAIP